MARTTLTRVVLLFSAIAVIGCDETGDDTSGTTDGDPADTSNDNGDTQDTTPTIWDGVPTTFTLADDQDPNLEANQDRLTDRVWLTRSPAGGPIYNAVLQDEPTAEELAGAELNGPAGTAWAEGSLDDALDLSYTTLRDVGGSGGRGGFKQLVGKNLVLHLIEDDIYLSVSFISWTAGSSGSRGGFAYERSTQP